ncbi:bifunctional diaminohydroxyphosphoribosylaminopyrimidine deaminase/5-amino-6-(5-phosphoribosylamino)uracil reductase RibD [Glaciecola sp. 1036]|uniref:bifunctional diaminohydroxyphosphoribosylaminopyrimidine deaminase/5-amino-6-(5-phosphoribosylamino)uracil reductase RibD n=1 Tax=Alteromonadaceae TaxID=72275 RepID=UPI003D083150
MLGQDESFMAKAIKLASKGCFSTTPNPNVGCVIVNAQGEVVGQGYHQKSGEAHAEIHALKQAGSEAEGSTAYVTLEPCSHIGRTGACATALIKAKIKRVVIACQDPNPLVAGNGISMLKSAGIEVTLGVLEQDANLLNLGFFKRMQGQRPYVTVKLACSLDGKTALANGKSKWITSAQSRRDVQIERAKACAILTGSGTVISDNPRLNVRTEELPQAIQSSFEYRQQQPLRVIIDGKNQLTDQFGLFLDGHPNLVYNLTRNLQLNQSTTRQIQVEKDGQYVDLKAVLKNLCCEQQINHLWVEAGANLCGALIQQQLVDRLIIYQAPMILGDKGHDLLIMDEITDLQNAVNAPISNISRIGNDVKLEILFSQDKA